MTFASIAPTVQHLTQLCPEKLRVIWDAAGENIPGDVAELGVYRGGVAKLLALRCPTRTVRLFDTFTGIPWDGYDAEVDRHKPGEFAAKLDEVRDSLSAFPDVTFHPGLFPHTTAGLDDARFALVHLDADLYASTLAGLRWFWPRMSAKGRIVMDDWKWRWCPGVERAVTQFFRQEPGATFTESAAYQLTVTKP